MRNEYDANKAMANANAMMYQCGKMQRKLAMYKRLRKFLPAKLAWRVA